MNLPLKQWLAVQLKIYGPQYGLHHVTFTSCFSQYGLSIIVVSHRHVIHSDGAVGKHGKNFGRKEQCLFVMLPCFQIKIPGEALL